MHMSGVCAHDKQRSDGQPTETDRDIAKRTDEGWVDTAHAQGRGSRHRIAYGQSIATGQSALCGTA
jgi:hypothetical protein